MYSEAPSSTFHEAPYNMWSFTFIDQRPGGVPYFKNCQQLTWSIQHTRSCLSWYRRNLIPILSIISSSAFLERLKNIHGFRSRKEISGYARAHYHICARMCECMRVQELLWVSNRKSTNIYTQTSNIDEEHVFFLMIKYIYCMDQSSCLSMAMDSNYLYFEPLLCYYNDDDCFYHFQK